MFPSIRTLFHTHGTQNTQDSINPRSPLIHSTIQNIRAFSPQTPNPPSPVAQVLLDVGHNAIAYATVGKSVDYIVKTGKVESLLFFYLSYIYAYPLYLFTVVLLLFIGVRWSNDRYHVSLIHPYHYTW